MATSAARLKLEEVLHERFGDVLLRERPPNDALPTGALGIEVPRGTLTEISGDSSSGRTSLLMGLLAHTTVRPEFCAFIDASNNFDPRSAFNAGVYLPHLLWLRCGGSAEKALKAADLIVQSGGFGVVALDLASVSYREARRISLASWFRLRHAVENTPTALVVIGQERIAGSASTLQVETHPAGFDFGSGLLHNLSVSVSIGPRKRRQSGFSLKPAYTA